MVAIKVIRLDKNVQDRDQERDQDPSSVILNKLSSSSLESLVLRAIERDAFPGAINLYPLCKGTERISKKFTEHASGKLGEEEIFVSTISALELKEDTLYSYRQSLVPFGFPVAGKNNTILSLDELREMDKALTCLEAGLKHYVVHTDSKAGLEGIKQFRTVFSSLIQARLDGKSPSDTTFDQEIN